MVISDLKDLEKLIKLMRRLGVERIEVDGLKFELSDMPKKGNKAYVLKEETYVPGGVNEYTQVPEPNIETPDALTEEQLLFYSSSGGMNLGPGETL